MSDLNTEAFSELIQRFAISALSRERKGEALNEEILAGKYTGEFYIKSKDGVVLSADILNRTKSATDYAVRVAELVGMTGEMFRVDFDYLTLPSHVDYGINILGNEPIHLPDNNNKMLIYLDFDEYDIIGDNFRPIISKGKVQIKITDGDKSVVIEKELQNVNYNVISLEGLELNNLQISEIIIERDDAIYNTDSTSRTIVLHNIFVTLNN